MQAALGWRQWTPDLSLVLRLLGRRRERALLIAKRDGRSHDGCDDAHRQRNGKPKASLEAVHEKLKSGFVHCLFPFRKVSAPEINTYAGVVRPASASKA